MKCDYCRKDKNKEDENKGEKFKLDGKYFFLCKICAILFCKLLEQKIEHL
jgi:hypothetical protein